MKNTDFRIGNFLIDNKERICKIESLVLSEERYGGDIHAPAIKGGITSLPVKPILLTEEWLERFGLIKKYLENQFEDGGFDLKEDGTKWYYWVDEGVFNLEIQPNGQIWFEVYACYRHIEYVHQLQNLYFALTGKELPTQAGGD